MPRPGPPFTINSHRSSQTRYRPYVAKSGRINRRDLYRTQSIYQEAGMLSAHEFATLMLVKDSADQIADRTELDPIVNWSQWSGWREGACCLA
ncbi:hypothetical protein PPGU19_099780 (plasmid) [Paraburkholderia sp. PGU19]|nr:hypothetical protein PPGU19_099780 [Paraburkholderia sp. PGU19]